MAVTSSQPLLSPEYRVLNDLFAADIQYVIPEYQRPYSWDCIGKSDKNNQVNLMWEDLITYFESHDANPYFLGSMVIFDAGERTFEVIDGQQRLTTLVLLFVGIKCFLKELKDNGAFNPDQKEELSKAIIRATEQINRLIFNDKGLGLIEQEKKLKIERSAGFDYDKVLKVVIDCGAVSDAQLEGATKEQKEVSLRYQGNVHYFIQKLRQRFLEKGVLTIAMLTELDKFTFFLRNKVAVVRILALSFDAAYQIFEILNNRGLPLSNKDLLRNFIINEFVKLIASEPSKYQELNANEKWQYLDENYELTNDFISRWVESRSGQKQRSSAFNDLKAIYKKDYPDKSLTPPIEAFHRDFSQDANYYTFLVGGQISNPILRNQIAFLLNAGNASNSLSLLLSLLRTTNFQINKLNPQAEDFIKTYQCFIAYLLLKPARMFLNAPLFKAINLLKEGKVMEAQAVFTLNGEEKDDFKNLLGRPIFDNEIAKLFIARYIWTQEEVYGDDVVTQKLNYNKATLEHIIPQNPEKGSNWLTNFSETFRREYTYRLGNFTLLTERLNSTARNFDFSRKRTEYAKTHLSLTSSLAVEGLTMDETFIINRDLNIQAGLLKSFDL